MRTVAGAAASTRSHPLSIELVTESTVAATVSTSSVVMRTVRTVLPAAAESSSIEGATSYSAARVCASAFSAALAALCG